MPEHPVSKESVLAALAQLREPGADRDVSTAGLLKGVSVCDGAVRVQFQIPADMASPQLHSHLANGAKSLISRVAGVRTIDVEFATTPPRSAQPLPGVSNVIAVGAGKGGVGKSTVAVLLALGLKRRGQRVGLLDADVYGPSLPKMSGTEAAQPKADDQGRLIPPMWDGMPIMSMGYMVPPDQAVVWRGPMAQKYVKEFLDRGLWGELDYLIVDLPPGTGDIPLTLAQSIPLTGAVVVCTPQDIALLDAVRALRMYQKLGVVPLGIVENMSYYVCPQCGNRAEIFSHGGCEEAAAELGVPFLGEIPLNIGIRISCDSGTPEVNFSGKDPLVPEALERVVTRLVEQVSVQRAEAMPRPRISIS